MSVMLAIYAAGVVAGLFIMRDAFPARVVTALAWPLGPLAFVVVMAIMTIAVVRLWPVPALAVVAGLAALVWLIS